MTNDVAREILNCTATDSCDACTINIKNGGDCSCQADFHEAVKLASIALEKHIPKKPINKGRDLTYCPMCGKTFWYSGRVNFCPDCGQAIDWGEND